MPLSLRIAAESKLSLLIQFKKKKLNMLRNRLEGPSKRGSRSLSMMDFGVVKGGSGVHSPTSGL